MDIESWIDNSFAESCRSSITTLNTCREILSEEVKIPLNVSCSNVLRGLLIRSGVDFHAKGTAWKSVHFHTENETQSKAEPSGPISLKIPQVEALDSALELAIYFLNRKSVKDAIEVLDSVENLCEVPPHSTRFPAQRIPLGVVGVCGEVFVCERINLVFNVHAYQDTAPRKYVATDTLSSKETDPSLQKIWAQLDDVRAQLRIS